MMEQSFAAGKALTFKKQEMTIKLRTNLCDLIPDQCRDKPVWNFYKVVQKPNQYYLISQLKLFQIEQYQQKYKILNQWDFSKYTPKKVSTHWTTEAIDTPSKRKFIYPALFQISENNYVVALIQPFNETYSGGAMHEEVADFFELLPNHQSKLSFQNIPFSVYRMTRACFTEEDYQIGGDGHCHDEENLILNIQYLKSYSWQMQYHYSRHLSPVSDQKPLNQKKNYILHNDVNKSIRFPSTWTEY